MSLRNPNSVDVVSKPFPGDDCKVLLFMMDDGSVVDEFERLQLHVAKLSGYVQYVADPRFVCSHPDVRPADVLIRVVCARPASDAMRQVQAVSLSGKGTDPTHCLRVEFLEHGEFEAQLKTGRTARPNNRKRGSARRPRWNERWQSFVICGVLLSVGSLFVLWEFTEWEANGAQGPPSVNLLAVWVYRSGGKWLLSGCVLAIGCWFTLVGLRRRRIQQARTRRTESEAQSQTDVA